MTMHIKQTIEDATVELKKREASVVEMKKFINQLCAFAGIDPQFPDANTDSPSNNKGPLVKRNAFFGRALATCVKEYLFARAARNSMVRETNIDDIFAALQEGGFDFSKIEAKESDRKRVISIMIAKNPAFLKLPNGDIGLADWYDDVARRKKAKNGAEKDAESNANDADKEEDHADLSDEPIADSTEIAESSDVVEPQQTTEPLTSGV